jgi:hypothetical protein
MFKRYDIVDDADVAALFEKSAAFVAEREKQPRKTVALTPVRARRQAAGRSNAPPTWQSALASTISLSRWIPALRLCRVGHVCPIARLKIR